MRNWGVLLTTLVLFILFSMLPVSAESYKYSSSTCYWCFGSDNWICPSHPGWEVAEQIRLPTPDSDQDNACCCPTGLYDSYPGVVDACDHTTAFYCKYNKIGEDPDPPEDPYKYSGYVCYNCFGTDSWECPEHPGWEAMNMTNPYGGSNDGLCGCPTGLYDDPVLHDSIDHTSAYYCTYRKTDAPIPNCTDSDRGKAADVPGITSGYGQIGSIYENESVSFTDKCWQVTGLTEYSCDSDSRVIWQHASCEYWLDKPATCVNGVCIPGDNFKYSGYICYNCFGTDSWECPEHPGWEGVGMTNPYGGDNDGLCGCPTGLYDSPMLYGTQDDTSTYYCTYKQTGPVADNDNDGFDSITDCNDESPHINPAALEICNEKDDDCDQEVDEDCITEVGFDYLIEANGTHLPVQFGWTLNAQVTETWYTPEYAYSGNICYNCFGSDNWVCPNHAGWSVFKMTRLPYPGADSDYPCCCPSGLYYGSYPGPVSYCDDTTAFYCTYKKTITHTQTLSRSDSGSAQINPDHTVTGDMNFLINFASHPSYQEGSLSSLQSSLTVNNQDVTASKAGSLSGTVYSGSISADSDATGSWNAQETGSGVLEISKADELVSVSSLRAPSDDTVYRLLSIKANNHYYYDADGDGVIKGSGVVVWMSGKNLYASSSHLPPLAYIDLINPKVVEKDEDVSFLGHGEDEDGTVEGYKWESHLDGLLSALSSFTTPDLSFGTHLAYFSVRDNDELWSPRDTGRVKINRKPIPVIYSLGMNGAGVSGEPVLFTGKGIDPDGYVTGYSWRSDIDGYLGDSDTLTVSDLSMGEHKIYFKVRDNDGSWSGEVEGKLTVRRTPVVYIHGYPFKEFPGNYKIVWHDDVIDPLPEEGMMPNVEFIPSKSSIPYYAGILDNIVLELKRKTGANKVDIVGYSLGGVIGRWYIQMGYRNDVRKFISVAGVNHGSDWAAIAYLLPFFGGEAGMEMLPHTWLYQSLNYNDKCATWGEGIDYKRPGVEYSVIAGRGYLTPAHKHWCINPPRWLEWLFGEDDICFIIPWATTNGDGVVPVRSAFISDTPMEIVDQNHGSMQMPFILDSKGKRIAEGAKSVFSLLTYEFGGAFSYVGFAGKLWTTYNNIVAIMMDDDVYAIIRGKLLAEPQALAMLSMEAPGSPAPESEWSEGNVTRAYHAFEPASGSLDGPGSANHAFEIDFTMEEVFFVLYGEGISMVLRTPSDVAVTPETPGINMTSADGMVFYQISEPEPGNWTAEVLLENYPGYPVSYTVAAFARTWVFVGVGLDKEIYKPGETINILTYIQYGNPEPSGVSASIKITKPDKTVETVSLTDSGTETLSALADTEPKTNETLHYAFTDTNERGEYEIESTVSMDKMGERITRTSKTTILVELFPDLWASGSDIGFSNSNPNHGETIVISADVRNSGELDASRVVAVFYDGDPDGQGREIGRDSLDIPINQSSTAEVSWESSYGEHDIFLIINPHDSLSEQERGNNKISRTIQVSDGMDPVADAGPDQKVFISDPVILDGSKSWDNVEIASFSWSVDDISLEGERPVLEEGFSSLGPHTIQLMVRDPEGNTDTDTVVVDVMDEPDIEAPLAEAGPDIEACTGDAVLLDAGGSSDNFGVSIYSWDLDTSLDSGQDGAPDNDLDLLGEQAEYSYQECGTHTVMLYVDDLAGNGPVSDTLEVDVFLRGDINREGEVNILDLASVGLAYGSLPGDANWIGNADVTGDGAINIIDLATVGLNYGRSC